MPASVIKTEGAKSGGKMEVSGAGMWMVAYRESHAFCIGRPRPC